MTILRFTKIKNIEFSLVSENTVMKYLVNLSANKDSGLDGIPARYVRDSTSVTYNANDNLKTARVVPLFKKNDITDVGHYRPVSI